MHMPCSWILRALGASPGQSGFSTRMIRPHLPWGTVLLFVTVTTADIGAAWALPVAPTAFCLKYDAVPLCTNSQPTCSTCHTVPPAHNRFGAQVAANLLPNAPRPLASAAFASGLSEALTRIEALDADGDGYTNLEELEHGSDPAVESDEPTTRACVAGPVDPLDWDVCNYDADYVYRKLHLDFCGQNVTYEQRLAFRQKADPLGELHRALDRCLDTPYWQGPDGVLYQIAHNKIRPIQSIKSGSGEGDVPLADYDDDYRLFVYTQIDNRDAREVLTAQYFVAPAADDSGRLQAFIRDPDTDKRLRGEVVGQGVQIERRAGLLTTRWNLVLNVMASALPRTAAAQAYRSFLGLDIAKMEGLREVAGEPVDYDLKGVEAIGCRGCHTTLDPLTYPFSRYAGFDSPAPFSYVVDRLDHLAEGPDDPLRDTPESGQIFGETVDDLLEWAQVAANSDAFARATVLDYWIRIVGDTPRAPEKAEFERLWRDFANAHHYGVERMLHDLIRTEAYGVP